MGSGKSFCAKIFEKLGMPVFYTDDVARQVINTNQELKGKIIKEFGDVYGTDGKIIPEKIRSIVFTEGNEENLVKLNKISHPYVFAEYENFCNKNIDKWYTIAESAILFETDLKDYVDDIIYVDTDEELRIKRTFERSGFSREEYKNRMKNQWSSDVKIKLSSFVITNNDGDDVIKQVSEIDIKLRGVAKR